MRLLPVGEIQEYLEMTLELSLKGGGKLWIEIEI